MRSLLRGVVTSLTFIFAALTVLASCKSQDAVDPRTTPRLVQVTPVQPATELGHAYTGVIAARVQSELGFRVPGKLVERLVDTGQTVNRGQPLMRIDPTDYTHAITVRVGDVAAARALGQCGRGRAALSSAR
jgi:multidrug efflux pump subunit AcrA (membrane-fusion protein)